VLFLRAEDILRPFLLSQSSGSRPHSLALRSCIAEILSQYSAATATQAALFVKKDIAGLRFTFGKICTRYEL